VVHKRDGEVSSSSSILLIRGSSGAVGLCDVSRNVEPSGGILETLAVKMVAFH